MGGNVGIQSSAIVVKGLASNSLSLKHGFQNIVKEIGGALINATICSSIIFLLTLCSGCKLWPCHHGNAIAFCRYPLRIYFRYGLPAFIKPDENRSGLSDRSVYYSDQRYHGLNIYLITGRLILTGLG